MNRSTGYLLALCAGVSCGWLAQEFWFAGLDQRVSSSQRDLLRNEQRLKALSERKQELVLKALPDKAVQAPDLSGQEEDPEVLAELLLNKALLSANDFERILKVAEYKLAQSDYPGAVLYLYDLQSLFGSEDEAAYMLLIHEFVLALDQRLETLGQLDSLIATYRQLTSLQPDYTPYYLSLAHWLIATQQWAEAGQSLALAKFDVQYNEEVRLLEDMSEELQERSKSYVVPLQAVGKNYLLELLVDDTHSLSLMLDTGASMTVVKTGFIQENFPGLLAGSEDLRLNTANGVVTGNKVTVPRIALGQLVIEEVALGALPLSEFTYDGLLGMDILKRFEFMIDQENQQLVLNP